MFEYLFSHFNPDRYIDRDWEEDPATDQEIRDLIELRDQAISMLQSTLEYREDLDLHLDNLINARVSDDVALAQLRRDLD